MEEIAPSVYVSTQYPGSTVGCIVVPGGAIAVDAPMLPTDARRWREQIGDIAHGPVLYTVLTDAHPDRLLGVGFLGAPVVASRAAYDRAASYTDGFWREIVETRGQRYPRAADALLTVEIVLPQLLLVDELTLHVAEEHVTIKATDGASPGSVSIYLRGRDVLFTGDTVAVDTHAPLGACVDSAAWMLTLRLLRRDRHAATRFVPGRGPVSDQESTRPMSKYLALARRRVRSLQQDGGSRSEVADIVPELMAQHPVAEEDRDIIQRRILAGLERLYDELQPDAEDEED